MTSRTSPPERSCRFCQRPLTESFCDLGMSPLSNAFVTPERATEAEKFYPLHAFVCGECFLVQLPVHESPEAIFGDYVYFSSYSETWLEHARVYAEEAAARFGLTSKSQVVEVASNDGYLLKHFVRKGIPSLGIEPAKNVARVAMEQGIETIPRFFGASLAKELAAAGKSADLLVGNNVLAHVPDLDDFVAGIRILLKPSGTATLEFPHLERLIAENQYDTIYHEHFSYLSLLAVERIVGKHGLSVVDVDELPTHGGSLRIHLAHASSPSSRASTPSERVLAVREKEARANLGDVSAYRAFAKKVQASKRQLLRFFLDAADAGKRVVGYGAPAKGNTLLNYLGIGPDLLPFTVDRSPHKQGLLLPGTRIPVFGVEKLRETRPDYVFVLPWNFRDEIVEQHAYVREWGGRFVTPIPELRVLP